MLSKAAAEIPTGDGWHYEPKWDGFRSIVFRGNDGLFIQSRDLKPLGIFTMMRLTKSSAAIQQPMAAE